MAGTPYKRAGRHCGAYARSTGQPCQRIKVRFCPSTGNWRCSLHGGASLSKKDKERITRKTGREFKPNYPTTPEAWARTRAGFRRYIEQKRISKLAKLALANP